MSILIRNSLRVFSFLLTAVFALTLGVPANAADAYNAEMTMGPQNGAIFLVGELGANENNSRLVGTDGGEQSWTCKSVLDPACNTSQTKAIDGAAILPNCESDQDDNCIVSLELASKDQEFQQASFVRRIGGVTYPEHRPSGFMEQSTPSIWAATFSPSASGTFEYAVSVKVSQYSEGRPHKFYAYSFYADVVPIRQQAGADYIAPYSFDMERNVVNGKKQKSVGGGGGSYWCVWVEDGACGVRQDFAEGTRVRLTIRLSDDVGGWFKGRIKDPEISIKKFNSRNNEIVVEAEPAQVARFAYVNDDVKNLTAKQKSFVKGFAGSWDGFTTWIGSDKPEGFAFVDHFRSYVKDTASGVNTFWNFGSAGEAGHSCLSDTSKVQGIISTNSMFYDGGIPKFSGGFINYKVAGLHYMPDGATEVIGTYDLIIRSEAARCLYKFSKAPVSATVTVTGGNSQNIATTVVSEKNGWLKLAAYGFTFSTKNIKIKLTQKKNSIACVSKTNSKNVKTVSSNQKCPSGFVKK